MKTFRIIILLLVVLTSSCSREDILTGNSADEISFIARSDDNSATPLTYRILAFNSLYKYKNLCGTYMGYPGEKMIPVALLPNGDIDEFAIGDNASYGIRITEPNLVLTCTSPGIECETDGSFEFVPADSVGGALYVSDTKNCSLDMGVFKFGTLKDRRARLRFNVFIDPQNYTELSGIKLTDFSLTGVGGGNDTEKAYESVSYHPVTRHVSVSDNPRFTKLKDCSPADHPDSYYSTDGSLFIASGIYAPKEVAVDILKPTQSISNYYIQDADYIKAAFTLVQNGGTTVNCKFKLNEEIPEIKPQHTYIFNFSIQSIYINISVDIISYEDLNAGDWYKEEILNAGIGGYDPNIQTINLGTWKISDWENHIFNDYPGIGN